MGRKVPHGYVYREERQKNGRKLVIYRPQGAEDAKKQRICDENVGSSPKWDSLGNRV